MGPTSCPEMSEKNYQHKLRTNSHERRPHAYYEIFQLETVTEEMMGEHNSQQG